MAYVLSARAHQGPFPNCEGEFCGNYHPEFLDENGVKPWFDPTLHRLGNPRPVSEFDSVAKMHAQGWRGKYLLADENPQRDITAVGIHGELDGRVIPLQSVGNRFVAVDPKDEQRWPWVNQLKKTPQDLAEPML